MPSLRPEQFSGDAYESLPAGRVKTFRSADAVMSRYAPDYASYRDWGHVDQEWNGHPRTAAIQASIAEHGQATPLHVREGELLDGHRRLIALRNLGHPVKVIDA